MTKQQLTPRLQQRCSVLLRCPVKRGRCCFVILLRHYCVECWGCLQYAEHRQSSRKNLCQRYRKIRYDFLFLKTTFICYYYDVRSYLSINRILITMSIPLSIIINDLIHTSNIIIITAVIFFHIKKSYSPSNSCRSYRRCDSWHFFRPSFLCSDSDWRFVF